MKQNGLLPILMMSLMTLTAFGQSTLMTYNIRYNNPNDRENWWENRKEEVAQLVAYYQPDILGIQEGLYEQVRFIDESLAQYSFIGVGRDDGKVKGEYAAIFYNTSVYRLLESQTYWLSETPEKISVGWDASMERITTYGIFVKRDTGDTLHVFNAHYDHIGQVARKKSSELIVSLIMEKGILEKHLVVMGDLNALPSSDPITVLRQSLNDTHDTSKSEPYGPAGTFNGFKTDPVLSDRIDYILTRNLEVISYRNIDDRRKNNLWPSDHLPVLAELEFRRDY